jgi:hypothetical protein
MMDENLPNVSNIEFKELKQELQPVVTRSLLKKTTQVNNDSSVGFDRKLNTKPTITNSVAKYGNMFARKVVNSDRNKI